MSVHVEHGVNTLDAENGAVVGKTLGEVRAMLRQPLNIDPASAAYVNGSLESPDYIVEDGDEIEFVKAAGTKGDDAIAAR